MKMQMERLHAFFEVFHDVRFQTELKFGFHINFCKAKKCLRDIFFFYLKVIFKHKNKHSNKMFHVSPY